jgi:hypothetical protein
VQVGGAGSWKKVALLAGFSPGAGHFGNLAGSLNTRGLVRASRGTGIEITEDGRDAIGDVEPLPAGEELRAYWLEQMGSGAPRLILQALIDHYPGSMTRAEIGEATGLSATAGHFSNSLGRLRTLGLAEGKGDDNRASADLFEGG